MMATWRDCRLGDLLEIKHGYAFLGGHFANSGSHIVLTPGNFHDEGGFKQKGDKEKWYNGPIPADYVLNEGDLIVAMTEQAEGLLGSSAIIPRSGHYLHNQRLGLVQIRDRKQADQHFVYYLLNSKPVRQQIRASASGVKIRHTAPSRIAEVKVSIPPLPVQRRIAGILSAYDELIENSQRRIQILEAMARALYREWFVHFRFPGHEKVKMVRPPSRPGGASSKTDGEIPQGWKLGKLADVCRVIPGYAFRSSDWQSSGVPVVKIKNIQQNNTIETENTDFVSDAVFQATPSKFVLGHGDILIAMTGATAGKIGKLRIKDRFLLNQRVAKILPDDVFRSLVWCAISTGESKERFFRLADGAAQPNMSGAQIESVELICPPRGVVEGFSRLADPILKQTDTLYLKIQNLRRTRDLLLPRLLSGLVNLESKTS